MIKNPDKFADLQALIDIMPGPVFVKNRAHRMILVNNSACEFFGRSRDVLMNFSDEDLYPADQVKNFHKADDRVFESGAVDENEEQVTDSAGSVRIVITRKRSVRMNDNDYLIGVVTDVTAYRESEAHNRYLAFHDTLTGLSNRALLKERVDLALTNKGHCCALLYIDLDRFKKVNDTHGHQTGDELIREFAGRLAVIAHATDTVARLGGDEFAILLADPNNGQSADEVCKRVLAAASEVFELTGLNIVVGASIGVAFGDNEDVDHVELQRRADVALYQAKNDGRGCSRVFTDELNESMKDRQLLESDLREALATGNGLEVQYQPIAGIESGLVEGFEALARWRHPTRGMIMPDVFIPIAEESGLILKLGEWVLTRACTDAVSWHPPLRLSVNVSPVQFAHGDISETVERVVRESGLDPRRLELEITEGVLMNDAVRCVALLNRIREMGVQIVLDDFGTGYSSLSYFKQFPFDKVKIDRSFITEMMNDSQARSIVEAVISLARGLDLPVVAEGVETQEQLTLLQEQGCCQAQGHLISQARPIERFVGSALEHLSAGVTTKVRAA